MKRILIGLAVAALSFNASAAWKAKELPVKAGDQTATLYAAYESVKVEATYPSTISTQCFAGKPQIVLLEIGEHLTVDHIESKLFIDGRVFRDKFVWTVSGNKLMFIAKHSPDAVKAMKRGNVMKITIDTDSFDLTATFDLQKFSASYNTVREKCEK